MDEFPGRGLPRMLRSADPPGAGSSGPEVVPVNVVKRREELSAILEVPVEELEGFLNTHEKSLRKHQFPAITAYYGVGRNFVVTNKELEASLNISASHLIRIKSTALQLLKQLKQSSTSPQTVGTEFKKYLITEFFTADRAQRAGVDQNTLRRVLHFLTKTFGTPTAGRPTIPLVEIIVEKNRLELLLTPHLKVKSVDAIEAMLKTEGLSLREE